ncbi:MAG: hypothetical protein SAL70_01655, partial [Scytonema sp. PMC 1070.18]|nr:hypothetical protein [Scytonema sp. PMC 1070.18]
MQIIQNLQGIKVQPLGTKESLYKPHRLSWKSEDNLLHKQISLKGKTASQSPLVNESQFFLTKRHHPLAATEPAIGWDTWDTTSIDRVTENPSIASKASNTSDASSQTLKSNKPEILSGPGITNTTNTKNNQENSNSKKSKKSKSKSKSPIQFQPAKSPVQTQFTPKNKKSRQLKTNNIVESVNDSSISTSQILQQQNIESFDSFPAPSVPEGQSTLLNQSQETLNKQFLPTSSTKVSPSTVCSTETTQL